MNNINSQNHQMGVAFHLILAFFTCGLWLPIWGLISVIKYIVKTQTTEPAPARPWSGTPQ